MTARSRNIHYRKQQNKGKIFVISIFVLILFAVLSFFVFGNLNNIADEPAIINAEKTDTIIITLHGDENTQVLKGEDYIESWAHAVDKKDGNITDKITISGNVDTNNVGEYSVEYKAVNKEGKYNTRIRKVKVVDKMEAPEKNIGVPVLMYHWVYQDGNPPADLNSNFISTSNLEVQLDWLKKENFYFPSYQELRAYIEGKHTVPKQSVILTFDDGESGFLAYGRPLFEKYKVPVTSFIIGNLEATPQNIISNASEYIDFQSHTYALHVDGSSGKGHGGKIFDLNKDQQVADFKKNAEILGTNEALAYPFGDYSDETPQAIQESGILCAFTVDPGFCKIGSDFTKLPRVRILGNQSLESYAATLK
ncbi:MAG: DUF5011 domain-containing protein [Coriobacteriia bacterium]|nr:DUF5011 domain-containing protein [Coriobacteriia bacterium]